MGALSKHPSGSFVAHKATMGRMHTPGKGISSSALPYRRTPSSWLKITPTEVIEHCCKLARKGLTPSQIGVNLRYSNGIAQVKSVTGNKILRILKSAGYAPDIPEDLYHMIKKVLPSASTWSATVRTAMPSSVSSSSSPESTVSLVTTRPSPSFRRLGSTSPPPPLPSCSKRADLILSFGAI